MSKDLIIQDVAECIITDLASGKVMAQTKLQMSSLEMTVNTEDLRAGIGNKKIFQIKSDKDLVVNTRNAVFTEEALAMTQGVDIVDSDTVEVTRSEAVCLKEGETEITLTGEPKDDKVTITDSKGLVEEFTVAGGKVDLTGKTDILSMDEVIVIYKEEVTGSSIEFDAEKFSKNVKLELRTIAYDLNTSEVFSDIYFVFPRASVSDEFSLSFEAGTVITPEISFNILQPTCGSAMGKMINVPRKFTP